MHAVRFMNATGNAHHARAHIKQLQCARARGRGGAGFTAHAASHAQTTEVQINAAYQIDPFPHNANPLENRLSEVGAASPVRLGTTHAVCCSTQTRSRTAARTNFAHYLSGLRAHVTEGSMSWRNFGFEFFQSSNMRPFIFSAAKCFERPNSAKRCAELIIRDLQPISASFSKFNLVEASHASGVCSVRIPISSLCSRFQSFLPRTHRVQVIMSAITYVVVCSGRRVWRQASVGLLR